MKDIWFIATRREMLVFTAMNIVLAILYSTHIITSVSFGVANISSLIAWWFGCSYGDNCNKYAAEIIRRRHAGRTP